MTLQVDSWLGRRSGSVTHLDDDAYAGGFTSGVGPITPWRAVDAPAVAAGTDQADTYNGDTSRVVCLFMSSDASVSGFSLSGAADPALLIRCSLII